jgi:dynein heavy chain
MELLGDYKIKITKLIKTKAELINAQNLFDLDVKPYPALQLTQSDVEQLDKIYSLYKNYKEFQESMSSMLWGDLDITALQKGAYISICIYTYVYIHMYIYTYVFIYIC